MRAVTKIFPAMLLFLPLASFADGAGTFSQLCASCHGKKGEGMQYVAPKLKGSEFVQAAPPEEIRETIRSGRTGDSKQHADFPAAMPPFTESQISGQALDELVAYLKGALQE